MLTTTTFLSLSCLIFIICSILLSVACIRQKKDLESLKKHNNDEIQDLKEQKTTTSVEVVATKVKLEMLEAQHSTLMTLHAQLEQQKLELGQSVIALRTENSNLTKMYELAAQEKEETKLEAKNTYEALQTLLSDKFKSIAHVVLQEKSDEFDKQSKQHLDSILAPLKMRLEDFSKQIQESGKERYNLKAQLKEINEININLAEQTKSLSDSLRGNNKAQGQWGEIVLEKVLELAGLQKDSHFICQKTLTNVSENNARPDVIIHLPDNKHVIIDAKTSFKSYDDYCLAKDQSSQEQATKLFIQSLKRHIRDLSVKEYEKSNQIVTVDFVIMFIPIEGAFFLGYQETYQFAWENNIIMASPTTIIPILRIINFIWKEKNQKENHRKIAQSAGIIHDKICSILIDIKKMKNSIDSLSTKSNEIWDDIYNKKIKGRGGIVSQLGELEKMGAASKKQTINDESLA